jgi:hypothetical protein
MMAKTVKNKLRSDTKEPSDTKYLPDRDAKITELAYYKAESRGFEPGHELDDWLEAEREFILCSEQKT